MPSEEVIAPRVPPGLRSRHRQSRMSTALQAMQPIVHGANIVSKVEDVHLHMRLFLKESCQKLESTTLTGAGRIPTDNFGV